ncbi:hypothetical protein V8C34DRAFT_270834 [Trichoderma compactum]
MLLPLATLANAFILSGGQGWHGLENIIAQCCRYMPTARRYTQCYPAAPLDCTLDQHLTRANAICFSGLLEAGLGGTIFLVSGTKGFFLFFYLFIFFCRG